MTPKDNGEKLRELIMAKGLTQEKARELVNKDQLRPIAQSTWKAYLADKTSVRRRHCPDSIWEFAEQILKDYDGE
ncbi:hypothetical protein ACEUAI_13265 [Aeromonas veronii]|uniref:hypothetical protein n=1 Tax=Aeromonas hydrophila TaxID=644 RepID=UPI00288F4B7E|nr:hypothetical protein [Aeromonas hydrophila]HDX8426022.1 hypothetical protein [Aeromonas veronii]